MTHIARQAIFTAKQQVDSYELLLHVQSADASEWSNPDRDLKSMIDGAMLVGLDVFANRRRIFVRCTRNSLLGGYASLFPAGTVLDLANITDLDEQIISACRQLRTAGYSIAVTGDVDDTAYSRVSEIADVVHLNFRLKTVRNRIKGLTNRQSVCLLARNIDTQADFQSAGRMGFSLFQGQFFARPVTMQGRTITGSRAKCVHLLRAATSTTLDLNEIEELIKTEPALCYRFLRYLNSAAFGFEGEVTSVQHALRLLGENELRKWLLVTCPVVAGEGESSELITVALIRARFCELIATRIGEAGLSAFLVGLFSLIEAILRTPMEHVLTLVQLPPATVAALSGEKNAYHRVLALALAYEAADWSNVNATAETLQIDENEIESFYRASMAWTQALG